MIDMLIICCVVESENNNAIGSTMKIAAQKILIFFDGVSSILSFLYENADITSVSASNVDAYKPIIVKSKTMNSTTENLDVEMSSTIQSAGLKPSLISLGILNVPATSLLIPNPPNVMNEVNVPSKPAIRPPIIVWRIVLPFEIFAMKNGVATHHAIQYAQ